MVEAVVRTPGGNVGTHVVADFNEASKGMYMYGRKPGGSVAHLNGFTVFCGLLGGFWPKEGSTYVVRTERGIVILGFHGKCFVRYRRKIPWHKLVSYVEEFIFSLLVVKETTL